MENIFDVKTTWFAWTVGNRNKILIDITIDLENKVLSQLMCNISFSFNSWLVVSNYHF